MNETNEQSRKGINTTSNKLKSGIWKYFRLYTNFTEAKINKVVCSASLYNDNKSVDHLLACHPSEAMEPPHKNRSKLGVQRYLKV